MPSRFYSGMKKGKSCLSVLPCIWMYESDKTKYLQECIKCYIKSIQNRLGYLC